MEPPSVAKADYDTSPVVAELYDHVEQYCRRADISFFVDAAIESGGPVLEIGCGTGRILIPTAEAGVEIVGIDSSAHMLAACREHLRGRPDEVQARAHLMQGDMRDMRLPRAVRLVTAPFRVFQFLPTVDEQLACLRSVHRLLEPEGVVILDLSFPAVGLFSPHDIGAELTYDAEFTLPDGRRVLRHHRFISKDRFTQTVSFHVIYAVTHPDGRRERIIQRFSMRYLYRYEAEHLLMRSGFAVRNVWAGYEKAPFGSKDPSELVIEATRV